MNRPTDRQARRYLRQVWKELPCSRKEKIKIVSALRESAAEILASVPNAGYEDFQERLGTPQQIAAAFVEESDSYVLAAKLRLRKRMIGIAVITVGLVIAILLGYLGICFAEVERNAKGKLVDGGVVIVEED